MTNTRHVRVLTGWIVNGQPEGAELTLSTPDADDLLTRGSVEVIDAPANPPAPEPDRSTWTHITLTSEVAEGKPGDIVHADPWRAGWLIEIGAAEAHHA